MDTNSSSKTNALSAQLVYQVFCLLKEAGGSLPAQRVFEELPKHTNLSDWALGTYEKTGLIRWRSILSFMSIRCVKAGFLIKQPSGWSLTEAGDDAISLGEKGLMDAVSEGYKSWKLKNTSNTIDPISEDSFTDEVMENESSAAVTLDQTQLLAIEGLKAYIKAMSPYEFQDLFAALLRGMGYHTRFIAPPGKDGGIDIIAYRDPLGALTPRIRAQIKHRANTSASVDEIRQLMGLLQKDSHIGIFVSTGGFTKDSLETVKNANIHLELIDFDRFISLWQEFYPKLSDKDKALLPLRTVCFLAPKE